MDEDKKKALIQIISPLAAAKYVTRIAWLFVVIIIIGGIVLSYYFCDWRILSRSGGIVIVCALLLALFDYTTSVKSFFKQANNFLGSEIRKEQLERVQAQIEEDLEQYGLTKSENEIGYMASEKLESSLPGAIEQLGNSFKMQSIKSEITIAATGTMISSFGDLVGNIPFLP